MNILDNIEAGNPIYHKPDFLFWIIPYKSSNVYGALKRHIPASNCVHWYRYLWVLRMQHASAVCVIPKIIIVEKNFAFIGTCNCVCNPYENELVTCSRVKLTASSLV
jgi:hypothetical protein